LSASASGAVVQEAGVVFQLCELLVECQQAAAASPAAAAASPFPTGASLFGTGSGGASSATSLPLPNLLAGLPTATSSALAAAQHPPSMTEDVASLYLSYAGKLSDVRSVMHFLEAMKLATTAQLLSAAAAPLPLANVARALPSSFCRHYFANRANLRAQLQYRLALFDWQTPIALLRIWQTASVHGGGSVASVVGATAAGLASASRAAATSDNLDTDNFVSLFRRRQTDPAALSQTVRACFQELVWGVDSATGLVSTRPLPDALLPLAVRQSTVHHIAQALLVLEEFNALMEFLDLVADMGSSTPEEEASHSATAIAAGEPPAPHIPFPSQILQQLFKAVNAVNGGHSSSGQYDLRWKLSLLSRVTSSGRWHAAMMRSTTSSSAKSDVFELFALALGDALAAHSSPAECWHVMAMALSVEETRNNWTSDGSASATPQLAFTPKHVRHPKLLEMANTLLAEWTPRLPPGYEAADGQAPLSFSSSRAPPSSSVSSHDLKSEQLLHLQKLLDQFVSSADAHAEAVEGGVPMVVDPLLDPRLLANALLGAVASTASGGRTAAVAAPVIHALWRYCMGMAQPRLNYFAEPGDTLLMHPVPLDPALAARAAELKLPPQSLRPISLPEHVTDVLMSYALGSAGAVPSSALKVPVFSGAITTPPLQSADVDVPAEYAVPPNPGFGWEVYLQQLRERRPLSIRFYRTAIQLQGCYPPVRAATPFDDIAAAAVTPVASASSSSSDLSTAGTASVSRNQSLLGRFQLMRVWKDVEDRLLWFESLALLPYVLRSLVEQRFSPQEHEDLQLKELLLTMLTAWTGKHAAKPLPAMQDVHLQLAAEGSGAGGGLSATAQQNMQREQSQHISSQFRKRHTQAIQSREAKKLAEVRHIVDQTFKACTEKIKMQRQRQLNVSTSRPAAGGMVSVAEAAASVANAASSATPALSMLGGGVGLSSSSSSSSAPRTSSSTEWLSSPSVVSVSRAYDRLLARVQHPAHLDGDPSVEAKMIELFKTPRDFVDLTVHRLKQAAFVDPPPPSQQQQATPSRPSALVFFDFIHTLLHFAHCKSKQLLFVRLMQSLSVHPQGLLAVLTPAAIAPSSSSASSAPAAAAKIVQQPQEDVMVALLQSMLHRRALAQASSEWTRPVLSVGFSQPGSAAARSPAFVNLSASAGSVQGANPLELQYLSHPSWWIAQALFWHFRAHQLDTRAFDTDLLFAVRAKGTAQTNSSGGRANGPTPAGVQESEGGQLYGYNSPAAVKLGLKAPVRPPNPFAITPRRVHTWVSKDAAIDARQLLLLAYDSAFQFLIHNVKQARNSSKAEAMNAAAVLGESIPATSHSENNAAGIAASPSSSSSSSAEAQALHYFTFTLFKHRYVLHREEGEARGMVVRPRRDCAELLQAVRGLLAGKRISKTQLDAATAGASSSSSVPSSVVPHSAPLGGALCSGVQGNSLYALFHLLSHSNVAALSEHVFNMVLASLTMFEGSGLRGPRKAQVSALLKYMQSGLNYYRLQPVTAAYIAQAALEQARLDLLAEPSSRGGGGGGAADGAASSSSSSAGQARARSLVQLASEVLEAHLHPRYPEGAAAFEFGRERDGDATNSLEAHHAAVTAPPNFPQPSPDNTARQ
jgi:hypothetical protein